VISDTQLRGLNRPAREAISVALLRFGMAVLLSEGLRQATQIRLLLVGIRHPPAAETAEPEPGDATLEQGFPSNVIDINTGRRLSLAVTSTGGRC
jgi:hypothetical protein